MKKIKNRVLAIAGSDSGGGAGIQADLKTFAAQGVFGLSAVTAVTAQNSVGIMAVHGLPADMVVKQIKAVVSDIGVHAAKTGMLFSAAVVEAVAATVKTLDIPNLVVDPVIISTSGAKLIDEDAVSVIKAKLLEQAYVVTPNRQEAEALTGCSITSLADARDAARRIHDAGPAAVIITGGHIPGDEVVDVLFDGRDVMEFCGPRIKTVRTHGTGCTFSAAVAAALASGQTLPEATHAAKLFVEQGIRHAPSIGHGHRPLGHFWRE